jgi:nickel-dependent lactate racemase
MISTKVHLQYGKDGLEIDLPSNNVSIIAPRSIKGIEDEQRAFVEAVRNPIASRPLREIISTDDRIAVVIPDITRPLPTDRLLSWLFAELNDVPVEKFVIINGTGSHRANTPEELRAMVGDAIVTRFRIVNHNSHDVSSLALAGTTEDGHPLYLNREYVEADKRIALGFIEPHFMAGFSGGYKGIFPALADIDSIMHYHRAEVIGHESSTWGVLEGNPTQEQIRRNGSLLPLDFCINVTLNRERQITRYFCGDVLQAHEAGCVFAKQTAMVGVAEPYAVVITTNSGYPLDQNLYQAVKGMSAAAQIVAEGGYILSASRCNDGFPSHGNFRKLLIEHESPRQMLDTILAPGFSMYDQWEAQLLAMVCLKARVGLYSELPVGEVRKAHLEPVSDITRRVAGELEKLGPDAPIAVMPEGPMTIPYLST